MEVTALQLYSYACSLKIKNKDTLRDEKGMKMYDSMSLSKKLGVSLVVVLDSPQQSWSKMTAGTWGLGSTQPSCQ